ncbi:hypothetical protein CAEBREN_11006 [Caenorhabditis brenneri]|uniref:Uncharacterized protein n=1 Tax=Caenorhabditis brenneri TaxID=135651 RepID=G0PHH6_CAEBE|nr:hypothetical protein CAEBREN_11006 [Caenorhabditis brenneri]
MLHNAITLPYSFEGDTFYINSMRPPPTTIYWDHGPMRFCFELKRNDPPPPSSQSQGWQLTFPHNQHIHPQMQQQTQQHPVGQFPLQHQQMNSQFNQQQDGSCMQPILVPAGSLHHAYIPIQQQHYYPYLHQGPPNNDSHMMGAPSHVAQGNQNQELHNLESFDENNVLVYTSYKAQSRNVVFSIHSLN